jgi:hypothetical protein
MWSGFFPAKPISQYSGIKENDWQRIFGGAVHKSVIFI